MQVEQAIFTSIRTRRSQGYHLIAQSRGLDVSLVRSLNAWGPSHASLLSDSPTTESINYAPLNDKWCAVSRTTYGGPEYSGRGGLQVFTRFLVLRQEQLSGFKNNPFAVVRTAFTLGHLRLLLSPPETLDTIEIPDEPLIFRDLACNSPDVPLHDVMRILRFQNRVAILGLQDPYPTLCHILRGTPRKDRLQLSFTTGLKPSVHREFQLHFVPRADANVNAQLTSQGIDLVTAT